MTWLKSSQIKIKRFQMSLNTASPLFRCVDSNNPTVAHDPRLQVYEEDGYRAAAKKAAIIASCFVFFAFIAGCSLAGLAVTGTLMGAPLIGFIATGVFLMTGCAWVHARRRARDLR